MIPSPVPSFGDQFVSPISRNPAVVFDKELSCLSQIYLLWAASPQSFAWSTTVVELDPWSDICNFRNLVFDKTLHFHGNVGNPLAISVILWDAGAKNNKTLPQWSQHHGACHASLTVFSHTSFKRCLVRQGLSLDPRQPWVAASKIGSISEQRCCDGLVCYCSMLTQIEKEPPWQLADWVFQSQMLVLWLSGMQELQSCIQQHQMKMFNFISWIHDFCRIDLASLQVKMGQSRAHHPWGTFVNLHCEVGYPTRLTGLIWPLTSMQAEDERQEARKEASAKFDS